MENIGKVVISFDNYLEKNGKRVDTISRCEKKRRYEIIAKYRRELIEILERLDAINKAFEVLFFI